MDDIANEGFTAQAREPRIEFQDGCIIAAECIEKLELECRWCQREECRVRLEIASWMRVERHHAGRPALTAGEPYGLADHRLMAAMHAIEIAKRQHAIVHASWDHCRAFENLHLGCQTLPCKKGCWDD